MPTNTRRAGIASLVIDGEAYDVASDLTYDPTQIKREALVGQSGYQGFSEMYKTGTMAFTLRDAQNLSVASINGMTNSTIVAVLASGKTVTGFNLFNTECAEVNTAEGTFAVKFEGWPVTESSSTTD